MFALDLVKRNSGQKDNIHKQTEAEKFNRKQLTTDKHQLSAVNTEQSAAYFLNQVHSWMGWRMKKDHQFDLVIL